MDTKRMIQELKAVAEKHRKDKLFTFQTNITAMCEDVIPKLEKLKGYEDLEEQYLWLKNPQILKDAILDTLQDFLDEYRSLSERSLDYFGGRADSMETAMRIIKAVFPEAEEALRKMNKTEERKIKKYE